jgi:hypothetical protein
MSLKAMSIVWSAGLPDRSMKLCALALADWCDDDGNSLHPSVDRVADRMSASRRTAQRTLHELMDAGLLEVVGNPFGGAPGTVRQYRLRLDRLSMLKIQTGDMHDTGVAGDTGDTCDTGDKPGTRRVTPVTQTGDTHVTQSVIEPSEEPSEERGASPKPKRATPRKRLDLEALPDDWQAYCADKRPDLLAAEVFERFRDHHTALGNVMADWFAAWRKWVGNESRYGRSSRAPPANPVRDRRQAMSAAIGNPSRIVDVEPEPTRRLPGY